MSPTLPRGIIKRKPRTDGSLVMSLKPCSGRLEFKSRLGSDKELDRRLVRRSELARRLARAPEPTNDSSIKPRGMLRNLGDPTLLLDFEEINMNLNNVQGPPLAGPLPQNHNGPSGLNLQMPAPDLRTMEELCQPTMNGRGGPIAPVNIQAMDFELKNHMIQQVQNSCQFHRLPGDDANKHLDKFLTITHSMKQNGVIDDALRLYLCPYSLTHHAIA
ncbi:hypothetical protein Tco_1393285 [Tanacetum coccineum]